MRERQTPFDSMEQFFDQMRREMFGSVGTPQLAADDGWDAGISIEETDEGFVVLADLPGFDREELSVRLHDDVLHLNGEHEVGDGMAYRSRRVSERISLPDSPDPEQVDATYHNGVLEIRFVTASPEDSGVDIHID
jgi:HSP20 family protein